MLSPEAKIKKAAYLKSWWAANSEKVKAQAKIQSKAWRDKNKDRVKVLKLRDYRKHWTKRRATSTKYYNENKEKSQNWQHEYYRTNENRRQDMRDYSKKYHGKESTRDRLLKKTYGMTLEEYNERLLRQNGTCAICSKINKSGKRLFVDHCHKTEKIRGLLCHNCNAGLGHFYDDPELMNKAAAYLKYP